ncbi:UNC93-like protein MFSD11 isoform X1 [Anopheles cruzii]|uniref:UNC93-like protein MFSD11 isoform X1 n=1 Tax=Anopheles cruzii TaxID=68878 RepID=UPI0022EC6EB2|nr:UNC93-like protein MFSD11 isoform X1 [Anopheles cruzii]
MVLQNVVNVFILGCGFMLIFTSFQTLGNIEQTIIDSIKTDVPTFSGDGYTSLAIIYAALSLSNWVTPSTLSAIGPRLAMIVGAITYCLFIACFFFPHVALLYASSVVLGAGAALIWTGQGMYLSQCSNNETISRNSGVFWALLQMSMFFGNLLVFFTFQGKTHIDEETRTIVFSVLIVVGILGTIMLACLRHPATDHNAPIELTQAVRPKEAFINAIRLFKTKRMMLLSITFVYTGLSLSFFSGVYGSSIGFTNAIGTSAKQLVGLNGVFIGIGEVLGGVAFGLLGSKITARYGRDPVVIVGVVIHLVSYFLIYINLPNVAPFGNTDEVSYIKPPNSIVAMLCSFLLGWGDACFNTQCYSMLGGVFNKQPAEAFSIFKFTQSVAAAASFVYSLHFGLHVQLLILVVVGIIGTVTFCLVEFSVKKHQAESETNREK